MEFPFKYGADEAPPYIHRLVTELVPLLIEGNDPALQALRSQLSRTRIRQVDMTGEGFFVAFDVPFDVPLAEPPNFAGGNASIMREGSKHPAGCVLFVRDGKLCTFELYTYEDGWPVDAVITSIKGVLPIEPRAS